MPSEKNFHRLLATNFLSIQLIDILMFTSLPLVMMMKRPEQT